VTATLADAAVAVLAVTAAAVFGASLDGLVTHPPRYGWNWTMLMDTEGGYAGTGSATGSRSTARPAGA